MPKIAAVISLGLLLAAPSVPAWAQTGAIREIQVRMSVGAPAPEGFRFLPFRPDYARMQVMTHRTAPGTLPRERRPELSEDLLVLVAVNSGGEEIYRAARPDPRLLRAETADDEGRLTSARLYRESVDFWIALPDDSGLDKVIFFHPEWSGTFFNLVPVGEVRLR